ncbi:porin family protein [Ferruginibacter sp.]
MHDSEFEKNMQQKMDELKFAPTPAVWDKIEAELPAEKKRRWIFFVLLFAGLFTGAAITWSVWNKNDKNAAKQIAAATKDDTQNINNNTDKKDTNNITADNTQAQTTAANTLTTTADDAGRTLQKNTGKKITTRSSNNIKIKKANTQEDDATKDDALVNSNRKSLNEKGKTKMRVKAPVAGNEDDNNGATESLNDDSTALVKKIAETDSTLTVNVEKKKDTVLTVKTDSSKTVTKKEEKKKINPKWQLGVEASGGISNVKNGIFSDKPLYSSALGNSSPSTGVGNPASPSYQQPSSPVEGAALSLGFYAQKNITAKWVFKTGLNYHYQSNSIKTGQRVDTAVNILFSSTADRVSAPSYYRNGNSNRFANQFHLLELPLLFQFKPTANGAFYIEGGPTIGYLLHSNALVYSGSTATYIHNKDLFNKLLFSLNAGAGFDIGRRSKFPFSIGARVQYSLNSVIKTAYAQQHFISTQLFLKVPLKK